MSRTIIETSDAPAPIGPYNQAVLVNHTLYVSGQIAIDPDSGDFQKKDIIHETHQVMSNLEGILSKAGMDFTNVVKCSIFVTDIENFEAVNNAYGEYFMNNEPAREAVQVAALPKGANIEISCIAVADPD